MSKKNAIWIDPSGKVYTSDSIKPRHAFMIGTVAPNGQSWIKKVSSIFDLVRAGWIGVYFDYYTRGEDAVVIDYTSIALPISDTLAILNKYCSGSALITFPTAESEYSDVVLKPLLLKYIDESIVLSPPEERYMK